MLTQLSINNYALINQLSIDFSSGSLGNGISVAAGMAYAHKADKQKNKVYKIYIPNNLRILPFEERFSTKENTNIDKLLNQTWSNTLTSSQFDEPCVLCGTLKILKFII